jgi:hypothetical protein
LPIAQHPTAAGEIVADELDPLSNLIAIDQARRSSPRKNLEFVQLAGDANIFDADSPRGERTTTANIPRFNVATNPRRLAKILGHVAGSTSRHHRHVDTTKTARRSDFANRPDPQTILADEMNVIAMTAGVLLDDPHTGDSGTALLKPPPKNPPTLGYFLSRDDVRRCECPQEQLTPAGQLTQTFDAPQTREFIFGSHRLAEF